MNKENTQRTNTRRANRQRLSTGNLLVIACVSFAVACLVLIMGYSFASLFLVNNRLQCSADEIAIAGAKKLNEKDRIGQMNNMVARCRQLVYSSRKDLDDTKKLFPQLESFAEPLLIESRDSADLLERERQKLAQLAESEARQEMQRRFNEVKPKYAMTLPWLKIETPQLAEVRFGRLDDIESNVEELHSGFKDLEQNDNSQGYVDREPAPGLTLYKCDLNNMQLPGADGDLTFKLSSLPAPVDGIIAPSRIVLQEHVQNITAGSAPSVTRIKLRMKVDTGLGFKTSANMSTNGVASTTGASLHQ